MRKLVLLVYAFINMCAPAWARSDTLLEQNKKTVESFYNTAFNQHRPAEAVKLYVGDRYIQHNPAVADGKQAFIDAFVAFQKSHPNAHSDIKRAVAEDDLVVLQVHAMAEYADIGRAVVEIFRLEKGKIVEHWDVSQLISDKPANSNTMF